MSAGARHPLGGRKAALASLHDKARVIAPPLARLTGLDVVPVTSVDTDGFGTFSGEVARLAGMRETAIAKARAGMEASGLDLGLASEGSFGPHPEIAFLPAGIEMIVLVDDRTGRVMAETIVDLQTNHAAQTFRPDEDPAKFLARCGFPTHAVIVKPNRPVDPAWMPVKGITDPNFLHDAITEAARQSGDGLALVQTDMRAHMNPTRMASIGRLADRFAARLASLCPQCSAPFFGVTGTLKGLACSECGQPTDIVRASLWHCDACGFSQTTPRPDGLMLADPGQCGACNP